MEALIECFDEPKGENISSEDAFLRAPHFRAARFLAVAQIFEKEY